MHERSRFRPPISPIATNVDSNGLHDSTIFVRSSEFRVISSSYLFVKVFIKLFHDYPDDCRTLKRYASGR